MFADHVALYLQFREEVIPTSPKLRDQSSLTAAADRHTLRGNARHKILCCSKVCPILQQENCRRTTRNISQKQQYTSAP